MFSVGTNALAYFARLGMAQKKSFETWTIIGILLGLEKV
jgi:hypothetical protein